MATTHESVAIKNSCFKQPVHPGTGLPTSKSEREKDVIENMQPCAKNDTCEGQGLSKCVNFDTSNSFNGTLPQDLSGLSDDAFYKKLVALKEEHKKTLELCEQLYSEKIGEKRTMDQPYPTAVVVSKDFSMSPQASTLGPTVDNRDNEFELLRRSLLSSGKDRIKDMSKPPTGRPKTAEPSIRRSISNSREGLNDSALSGRSTVSGMWEKFSVDEYTSRSATRPRSASLSRLSSSRSKSSKDAENEKKKKQKEWKHRITIPKPFNMTLRDANRSPQVSRVSRELEQQREEQIREEEAEMQKKFKARPVPAHVYMPLYDEIMEKEETKRRENKEMNKQLLKSQEKPFKFMQREEEKKQERKSRPKSAGYLSKMDNQETKQFKAKPFPAKLFEGSVVDKLKEEDEYRSIRVQMRSQELLKTASLPPNMASRGQDYVDGKSRQKMYAERARKAELTPEHKFKPKTNPDMPNFDDLHRQYMKEVAQRKAQREATVCKPFNLRTSGVDTKHKVYDDIKKDEETLKENRWPFQNPRAKPFRSATLTRTLSTSMDALPAQMTAAAQLRASSNKEKLEKKIQAELDELEAMRKKRIREQMLKQSIKEKSLANDQTYSLERQRKQKLKEFRESELARQEEYKSDLAEMKERVDKKPFLFERTAQDNARRAATKKYQETLAAAGVDEDFVERKGASASASIRTGNTSDEDDALSPRYSSRHSSARSSPITSKKYTDTFEPTTAADRTASEDELEADQ